MSVISIRKKNGDPVWKTITSRTRLKFSIAVIVANFILGIIAMLLGSDLTELGIFLAMSNSPLYVYVLGESLRPTKLPESYFNQQHGGSGGLGTIIHGEQGDRFSGINMGNYYDGYTMPPQNANSNQQINIIDKKESEIG